MKENIILKEGNTYLINAYSVIYEAYVDKITKTSYKFIIERTDGTWCIDWVSKERFENNHKILESLGKREKPLLTQISINDNTIKTTKCPICNGDGEIPDEKNTIGKKICPKCWGSGVDFI
jgi:hypothetical protein